MARDLLFAERMIRSAILMSVVVSLPSLSWAQGACGTAEGPAPVSPPLEIVAGGLVRSAPSEHGSGWYVGVGANVGRRTWLDVDAMGLHSRSRFVDGTSTDTGTADTTSVGVRLRWENTGGSIATGVRWLEHVRRSCWGDEDFSECGSYQERIPLPSLEWRAGRLDGFHHTGSLLGGARTNPNLAILRMGVGHPLGRTGIRLEAGADSTAGGYLLADVPVGGGNTIRATVGSAGAGRHSVGVSLLMRFR